MATQNAVNNTITGNAATATKWATARNLAGNSVDGSANVAFANNFIVQGTTDAGLSGAQFLGALGTGIVKNTTTTGVLSIAVAGDFPTLNQNTTGSAATLTTTRTIWGQNFNGSANVTGDLTINAANIITDTTTGLKIGTSTSQKIGFFNSTPIVQQTGDLATALIAYGLLAAPVTIAATSIGNRTLWGQVYDGTANVTGSLTAVTDITGGASSMIITAGTGNSRTLTLRTTTSGGVATNALVIDATQKITTGTWNATVIDSTYGGTGVNNAGRTLTLNTNSGTLAFSAASKTLTVAKTLTLDGTDSTTMTFPSTTATIARTDAAQTFTGTQTFSQIVTTNNAITAVANAATVPITSRISTVTNNSAATLTITITTTSAVDGQIVEVRVLDFSGVSQTLAWVNTENSNVNVPTTTNGSTTLPLSVLFQFNSATTKWRCLSAQ